MCFLKKEYGLTRGCGKLDFKGRRFEQEGTVKCERVLVMEEFERMEYEGQDEEADSRVSVPLGGPINVPNFIGALTCVPEFEALALRLLQELEVELELDMGSSSICEEDLSDAAAAIENAVVSPMGEVNTQESTKSSCHKRQVNDNCSMRTRSRAKEDGNVGDNTEAGSSVEPAETNLDNGEAFSQETCVTHTQGELATSTSLNSVQASGRKRKRRGKAVQNEDKDSEGYLARVEEIVKLKHKQEYNKAVARLHSFNGSRTIYENTAPSVEKNLTALRSLGTAKAMTSIPHEYIPIRSPEVVLCIEVFHNI